MNCHKKMHYEGPSQASGYSPTGMLHACVGPCQSTRRSRMIRTYLTQRVQVLNDRVYGFGVVRVKFIIVQVLGKHMILRYLDPNINTVLITQLQPPKTLPNPEPPKSLQYSKLKVDLGYICL